MVPVGEQDRDIDHGQAGTQHQDRIGRADPGDARLVPRIGDQPAAVAGLDALRLRQPRRQVADAQHGDVRHLGAVVVELQPQHAVLFGEAQDATADPAQGDIAGRGRLRLVQEIAQIASIDATRDEGVAGGRNLRRRLLRQIMGPQPAQEMARVGGERAHVGDPRVQEQPVVPGSEGDTRPEGRRLIEQKNLRGRGPAAQQLDRQLAAAEAGADDRNPHNCLLRFRSIY